MKRPPRDVLAPLVEAGYSDHELGDRFGVAARTVLRWRRRYGLPSAWTPPLAAHGTEARYRQGCSCTECRAAHAADHRAFQRRLTLASAATATRAFEPWTPDEDTVVLEHPPAEAAPLLGRSWHACRCRRDKLRRLARRESDAAA